MGVHNIDLELNNYEVEDTGETSNPGETSDLDESQLTVQTEAWKSLQLDFNTTRGPYE